MVCKRMWSALQREDVVRCPARVCGLYCVVHRGLQSVCHGPSKGCGLWSVEGCDHGLQSVFHGPLRDVVR